MDPASSTTPPPSRWTAPASSGVPISRRLIAALVFAASTGVLLVAAFLAPSPQGMGTHMQLGLPACGMKTMTGLPCPTCGMTTAFAHAADGRLLRSFQTQPAGAVLALLTAMLSLISGYALLWGLSLAGLGRLLTRPHWIGGLIALILLAWIWMLIQTLFFPVASP